MIEKACAALFRQVDPRGPTGSLMSSLPEQPLSPLDGRYRPAVASLGDHLSEAGLNRARVRVEVEWLIALTDRELFGSKRLEHEQARALRRFAAEFGAAEIDELAALEATTRHDVKAVEYLVRRRLSELGLNSIAELTHFALTSEDINNLAYALTIGAAVREVWLPRLREVIEALRALAVAHRDDAMLAHTHGQPATPTTMGKELAVFVARLERMAGRDRVHRVASASSTAPPAPSPRTSRSTRRSTGRASRGSSSRPLAWSGTR